MALAPQVESLRATTECAAQAMLGELGWDYRPGIALQSVSDFQTLWNRLYPEVQRLDIVRPSKNGGLLVVDGQYGPQTSMATQNFVVGSQLPARAEDVPVWYAANQGAVEAMCPPAPPMDVVPEPMQEAPQQYVPEEVMSPPPEYAPMPEVIDDFPPVEIVDDPVRIKEELNDGPIEIVVAPAPGLVPENDVRRLPGGRIEAPARSGDVPVFAIAAGVLAVGAVAGFWYYTRRKA